MQMRDICTIHTKMYEIYNREHQLPPAAASLSTKNTCTEEEEENSVITL